MDDNPEARRWLARAVSLAVENVESGQGGPFGAVIVRGGELISEGVNRVTSTPDPTAHAEISAIRAAARSLGVHELSGCDIYTSCEPCPMCLGAILWARMDRVWYAASQEQASAAGFDDLRFYEQLRLQPGERNLFMRRALLERAGEPFAAWERCEARVPY